MFLEAQIVIIGSYPGVYAKPGNGKSSIGQTFASMIYRTIIMTDPSAANFFRIFGNQVSVL